MSTKLIFFPRNWIFVFGSSFDFFRFTLKKLGVRVEILCLNSLQSSSLQLECFGDKLSIKLFIFRRIDIGIFESSEKILGAGPRPKQSHRN